MTSALRWLAITIAAALLVVACTNPDRPSVQADAVVLPTPLRSFDASVTATVALLGEALGQAGIRLDVAKRPYRPAEPQPLLQTPRAVLRADLADPDDGFLVVYDFDDAAAAAVGGHQLADYLASGFGQTNFPVDAQFSVGTMADTVVFTWWSRARSDDPARAEAVFDAAASVGEAIKVLK